MTVEVPLTQGCVALIDDEDAVRVLAHKWFLKRGHAGRLYAARMTPSAEGRSCVVMHRELMNATEGVTVDHKDRDGLNNRRSNLRFATAREQVRNRGGYSRSGYKGIARHGRGWRAQIQTGEKKIVTPAYDTPEQAARAYDKLALEAFGEFAVLNFADRRK